MLCSYPHGFEMQGRPPRLMKLQDIIDQHYVAIRRTACAMTRDDWEADEITQETFMIACRRLETLRDPDAARAWLVSICIRVRRSRSRSAVRQVRHLAALLLTRDVAATSDQTNQDASEIWNQVRRLPAKQSEAIVLRYLHEMTVQQAAAVIGCSEGTIKSRVHHGLKKLRENAEFRSRYEFG